MARIASTTTTGVPAFPAGPGAGLTLDALMLRQRELAAQQGRISPNREMISPWQGAAFLGDVVSTGINQGRAENQLAQGRDELAQTIGGINWEQGPTGAQIAEAMTRDPDVGLQLAQAARDAVRAARERQQQIADRDENRAYTEGYETRKFDRTNADQIADEQRAQLGQTEDEQRAAAQKAADEAARIKSGTRRMVTGDEAVKLGGRADRTYEVTADGTDITDVTPTVPDQYRPLTPEERQQYGITGGGKWNVTKNEPEAMGMQPIPQKPLTTKDLLAERKDYITFDTGVRQLNKALDLLGQGIDTGLLAGLRTNAANVPIVGTLLGADEEVATRTRQFNDIMNSQATQQMAQTLKGATTDTEMSRFMEQMNNPRLDPKQKQEMLVDFLLGPAQSRMELSKQAIMENGGQVPEISAPTCCRSTSARRTFRRRCAPWA